MSGIVENEHPSPGVICQYLDLYKNSMETSIIYSFIEEFLYDEIVAESNYFRNEDSKFDATRIKPFLIDFFKVSNENNDKQIFGDDRRVHLFIYFKCNEKIVGVDETEQQAVENFKKNLPPGKIKAKIQQMISNPQELLKTVVPSLEQLLNQLADDYK